MPRSTNLQAPAYAEAASRRQAKSQTIFNPAMAGPISNGPNIFVSDFGYLGNCNLFGIWDLDFGISTPFQFPGKAGGYVSVSKIRPSALGHPDLPPVHVHHRSGDPFSHIGCQVDR